MVSCKSRLSSESLALDVIIGMDLLIIAESENGRCAVSTREQGNRHITSIGRYLLADSLDKALEQEHQAILSWNSLA